MRVKSVCQLVLLATVGDVHQGETILTKRPPTRVHSGGAGDVGRNMSLSALSNLVAPLAAIATAPVLAQALGVAGRGEASAATAPLLLMSALAAIGLPEALNVITARAPQLARKAALQATLILAVSGAIATVISILLTPLLAGDSESLRELIPLASLAIVPTLLVGVLRGAAAGQHAWRLVNAEKFLASGVRTVAILGSALAGVLTVEVAILIMAISPVIGGLPYLRLNRTMATSDTTVNRRTIAGQLFGFGSRIWIGSLSGILLSRLSQVIITPLSTAEQLGLFVTAVTVSEVALIANNAVRDVTLSSDAATSDNSRLERSARASFFVSLVVGAGLVSSLWWWFPLLFGEAFAPAVPVAIILVVAAVFGVPGSVAGAGLSSRGRPGLRSIALVTALVVNVVGLLALAPLYGAVGAAVATLIGSLISSNLNVFFLRRHFNVRAASLYIIRGDDVMTIIRVARRLSPKRS
jgi:O-antigen/teichoic acid export membrane protein